MVFLFSLGTNINSGLLSINCVSTFCTFTSEDKVKMEYASLFVVLVFCPLLEKVTSLAPT